MKAVKKFLAVTLAAVILLSCTGAAFASTLLNEEKNTVTIFVEGINAAPLISTQTGEEQFPPEAMTIVSAVVKCLPQISGMVLFKDFESVKQPLVDAVNGIFMPVACDEHGKPAPGSGFGWDWMKPEDILRQLERDDTGAQIKYCFDWRLDMKTIASDLHDYIEYVMDVAGAEKVNLIGFSMGTCAVMSYLKLFDYEYVNAVVLLAGGYNGVSCCGQPFAGHIDLNSDSVVRFADAMLGGNVGGAILSALLHSLNHLGIMDIVASFGNKATGELKDAVYQGVFSKTFATMPGMWSLVPAAYYDEALAMIGDGLSAEVMDMIAWYHDEVQANNEAIIQGCLDRGINFGIVAKYGFPSIPLMDSADAMSDGMIDTTYESLGAICADADSDLGENYVQAADVGFDCVSPDNMIDASTCAFPEYTWFIKNSYHSDDYPQVTAVCYSIIEADGQVTVNDGEYGQFLTVENGEVVALDGDNGKTLYYKDMDGENLGSIAAVSAVKIIGFIKDSIEQRFAKIFSMFTC